MNETHDIITDRLSDYLDGELDEAARATVDEHLSVCAGCREVLDDLRAVVDAARRLRGLQADGTSSEARERELWEGIEGRIQPRGTPVVPFTRAPRRFAFTLPQLAAAAAVLMVLSGGLVYIARPGDAPTGSVSIGGADAGAGAAGGEMRISPVSLADPQYDDAIGDLERTLAEGRGRLDPETVRVLEQNLATIDKAIAQSRQALEADPGNVFLNGHLVSARQRKLALLRRATALTTGS